MEVRHETERPLLTKRNENFCKCICISINNIDQKFSFTFGSHYNRNENVLIWIIMGTTFKWEPLLNENHSLKSTLYTSLVQYLVLISFLVFYYSIANADNLVGSLFNPLNISAYGIC